MPLQSWENLHRSCQSIKCESAFATGNLFCPFSVPQNRFQKNKTSSSRFKMVSGMLTSLPMFDRGTPSHHPFQFRIFPSWCCSRCVTEVEDIDCCNCCMWFWPVNFGRTPEISWWKADTLQTYWVQGMQSLPPKSFRIVSYTATVSWKTLFQSVLRFNALFRPETFRPWCCDTQLSIMKKRCWL